VIPYGSVGTVLVGYDAPVFFHGTPSLVCAYCGRGAVEGRNSCSGCGASLRMFARNVKPLEAVKS